MLVPVSGTIRRCDLVGACMALGEVRHCEVGLWTLLLAAYKTVAFSCLPSELDVELSAPPW